MNLHLVLRCVALALLAVPSSVATETTDEANLDVYLESADEQAVGTVVNGVNTTVVESRVAKLIPNAEATGVTAALSIDDLATTPLLDGNISRATIKAGANRLAPASKGILEAQANSTAPDSPRNKTYSEEEEEEEEDER